MKNSILCLVFWSFSLIAYAEESTKVTVTETGLLMDIPYLTLKTSEETKAYKVQLFSTPSDQKLTFYVDWPTYQEIPLTSNSYETAEVIFNDAEIRIIIPYFELETPERTKIYKVELFSPNTNTEPVFIVDWSSLQEITLSKQERDGLVFMREEEKLARDVYLTFYQIWGQKIFDNISNSEQTHTDEVVKLLDYYQITDPVGDNAIGEFVNTDLQNLYDSLVAAGAFSLSDALMAGAAIEEIDLVDLQNFLTDVDHNEDIAIVYNNLMEGSRNHLRAFVRNLEKQGITYTPQYLDLEEYDSIINETN